MRDPGDDQLSEYDDHSSDNDSDDFAVEEDGAIRDIQNEELGFLLASRRTRSGRIVKRLTRLCFERNFSKCNGMQLLFKEKRSPFFRVASNACLIFREL